MSLGSPRGADDELIEEVDLEEGGGIGDAVGEVAVGAARP